MALVLVNKRDLSPAVSLAAEEEQWASQSSWRSEEDRERTGVRLSALSQRLLMLTERTELNRLPQAERHGDPERWLDAIRELQTNGDPSWI